MAINLNKSQILKDPARAALDNVMNFVEHWGSDKYMLVERSTGRVVRKHISIDDAFNENLNGKFCQL